MIRKVLLVQKVSLFITNPKDLNRAAKSPALNAFGWQTRKQQYTAKEHHGVKLMTV